MIYGSETWAIKSSHIMKLVRTERRMIRWMCGVKLCERVPSAELIQRIGVEEISVILRRHRLRWFGHVERKGENDWVKKCTMVLVDGVSKRGRPKKTWEEVIRKDLKEMGLTKQDA